MKGAGGRAITFYRRGAGLLLTLYIGQDRPTIHSLADAAALVQHELTRIYSTLYWLALEQRQYLGLCSLGKYLAHPMNAESTLRKLKSDYIG